MEVPARIGRYEVAKPIGHGGPGEPQWLLAKDSVLGRYVAVRTSGGESALWTRQDALISATITHPSIARLYDMGEEPAPVGAYLVYEYVEGPTLRQRVTEGALDLTIVARMARELGDALTVAHDAGLAHGDVRLERIVLTARGAKLLGLGAKAALDPLEQSSKEDQAALARSLFEAIGAKPPPAAKHDPARDEPSGPSLGIRLADPRLASRLEAILGKAMAKRYPSCRAFGDALAQTIEVRAFDVSQISRVSELPPRSLIPRATRRAHNMFAAIALLVIIGLVVMGKPRQGLSLRHVADDFVGVAGARGAAQVEHHGRHPGSLGASPSSSRAGDASARAATSPSDAGADLASADGDGG